MSEKLLNFIRHARLKGMDHSTIRVLLLSAGWREKEVARGLAQEGLDLPVPDPPVAGGAKEAFQYSLTFLALGFVVINVVLVCFEYLDALLPDASEVFYEYELETRQSLVRWWMAMLMVAFPLFLGCSYWIARDLRKDGERAKSPVRRWLTHLALLLAAISMMGDGFALVYGFLQGELTARFTLKVLTVLLLAVGVFSYYRLSLRLPEEAPVARLTWLNRAYGSAATVCVLFALVVGFQLVESPLLARIRKLDDRRVADLMAIESAIDRMAIDFEHGAPQKKRELPATLAELKKFVEQDEFRGKLSVHDPESGELYEYAIKGPEEYELCATFALEDNRAPLGWTHPAGKHCYRIELLSERRSRRYP